MPSKTVGSNACSAEQYANRLIMIHKRRKMDPWGGGANNRTVRTYTHSYHTCSYQKIAQKVPPSVFQNIIRREDSAIFLNSTSTTLNFVDKRATYGTVGAHTVIKYCNTPATDFAVD